MPRVYLRTAVASIHRFPIVCIPNDCTLDCTLCTLSPTSESACFESHSKPTRLQLHSIRRPLDTGLETRFVYWLGSGLSIWQ